MENIHMREWTTLFITWGRYNCKRLLYKVTVVYIWQSVLSVLNNGYHLSRNYVVLNEVYSICTYNVLLKYSQHTGTEVGLRVFSKAKQNRNELPFLSNDTNNMQHSYWYINVYTRVQSSSKLHNTCICTSQTAHVSCT